MLMPRLAPSESAPANYTVKRNWRRRDPDQEAIVEGLEPFASDPQAADLEDQYTIGGAPVVFVHQVRWEDGTSSIVAGTATTLFVHQAPSGWVEPGWVEPGWVGGTGRWRVIASGLSPSGRRWEADSVNGDVYFNNAVDLPIRFRKKDDQASVVAELRENGIIQVGTIVEYGGSLVSGDILEVPSTADLADQFRWITSGSNEIQQVGAIQVPGIAATLAGSTMTATSPSFISGDAGRIVQFEDGQVGLIAVAVSPTEVFLTPITGSFTPITSPIGFRITSPYSASSVAVDAWSLISPSPFFTVDMVGQVISVGTQVRKIVRFVTSEHVKVDSDVACEGVGILENREPYRRIDQMANPPPVERRPEAVLWSNAGDGSDYAVRIPVAGEVGSPVVRLERMTLALSAGDEVVIEGGAPNGATLSEAASGTLKIVETGPGFAVLNAPLTAAVSEMSLRKRSALAGSSGFESLFDQGGPVLKMLRLGQQLVIYKQSIFLGEATGVLERPFRFTRVDVPHERSLHFRNAVVALNDAIHVFPGRDAFWSFDPVSRQVRAVPNADYMDTLFFDHVSGVDREQVFAADNAVTQQVWWVNYANPTDPIICYDYRWNTFSTMDTKGINALGDTQSIQVTSAVTMQGPGVPSGATTEAWFVMGTSIGTLMLFGLVTDLADGKPDRQRRAVYSRRFSPTGDSCRYEAVLQGGLATFGDDVNLKETTGYLLQCGGAPSTPHPVTLEWWRSKNQSGEAVKVAERIIPDVRTTGWVGLHFVGYHFRDVIRVLIDNPDKPIRILSRTWQVIGGKDSSHGRSTPR